MIKVSRILEEAKEVLTEVDEEFFLEIVNACLCTEYEKTGIDWFN